MQVYDPVGLDEDQRLSPVSPRISSMIQNSQSRVRSRGRLTVRFRAASC
jgi:hypothetical protein